uniref:Uncharacterized protein n=1 Tax=Arundo donax TaxID=35708 RepID=A0A0A8YXJ2_ARUDO
MCICVCVCVCVCVCILVPAENVPPTSNVIMQKVSQLLELEENFRGNGN